MNVCKAKKRPCRRKNCPEKRENEKVPDINLIGISNIDLVITEDYIDEAKIIKADNFGSFVENFNSTAVFPSSEEIKKIEESFNHRRFSEEQKNMLKEFPMVIAYLKEQEAKNCNLMSGAVLERMMCSYVAKRLGATWVKNNDKNTARHEFRNKEKDITVKYLGTPNAITDISVEMNSQTYYIECKDNYARIGEKDYHTNDEGFIELDGKQINMLDRMNTGEPKNIPLDEVLSRKIALARYAGKIDFFLLINSKGLPIFVPLNELENFATFTGEIRTTGKNTVKTIRAKKYLDNMIEKYGKQDEAGNVTLPIDALKEVNQRNSGGKRSSKLTFAGIFKIERHHLEFSEDKTEVSFSKDKFLQIPHTVSAKIKVK